MHLAVDGSPLVERADTPSSLHLIEWLQVLRNAGTQISVLYPQGGRPSIPENVGSVEIKPSGGARGRTWFLLRDLPRAAGDVGADLLMIAGDRAPFSSPCPIVTLADLDTDPKRAGLTGSLAAAVGKAGSMGATARLFPSDGGSRSNATRYAPFVGPGFTNKTSEAQNPYFLCFGFDQKHIPLILSAWTWVDGSLGDSYPLVFAGANQEQISEINRMSARLDIEASVLTRPAVSFDELPSLYWDAAAYLGTGFAAAGQPIRWALATGTPVVGLKTMEFESMLGEAAYLVPEDDSRTLGAACLTVLIQERVSEPLVEKGLQRAKSFRDPQVPIELVELLTDIAGTERGVSDHGE